MSMDAATPETETESWTRGMAGLAGGFIVIGAAIALKLGLLSLFGKKGLQ